MLYEVITTSEMLRTVAIATNQFFFIVSSRETINEMIRLFGGTLSFSQLFRITSYNVCYTKLLRNVFAVLAKMNQNRIRRIPVVEGQKVVGIIYLSDLFFYLLGQLGE